MDLLFYATLSMFVFGTVPRFFDLLPSNHVSEVADVLIVTLVLLSAATLFIRYWAKCRRMLRNRGN